MSDVDIAVSKTCTRHNKKHYKPKVHKLVAEAFCRGRSEEKRWALHKDGNNQNNRATNIYWGSPADNVRDMHLHGNARNWWTSEKNVARKLKLQSVKRIKRILKEDKSRGVQSRLAREYNVAPKTISDIKVGKSWQNMQAGKPQSFALDYRIFQADY